MRTAVLYVAGLLLVGLGVAGIAFAVPEPWTVPAVFGLGQFWATAVVVACMYVSDAIEQRVG